MKLDTSAAVAKFVAAAVHPEDIFFAVYTEEELKDAVRDYQKMTHPDTKDGTIDAVTASAAFNKVQQLYDAALIKITNGTYGDLTILPKPITVATKQETYTLTHTLPKTDTSNVYSGTNSKGEQIILKVSRKPVDNDLLLAEKKHLTEVRENAETKTLSTLLYLPVLKDSFLNQSGNISQAVNVFASGSDKYYSLLEIRKAYPNGVPLEHAAWMFNRVLQALEAPHFLGIIHGAILPQNVIINPATHQGILVNWDFSVKAGASIKAISKDPLQRSWYPREVFEKGPAFTGTDLYMAANLFIYLCGGSIGMGTFPDGWEKSNGATAQSGYRKIRGLINACRLPATKRLFSVHELYDDFKEALAEIFGKPVFREFTMPKKP